MILSVAVGKAGHTGAHISPASCTYLACPAFLACLVIIIITTLFESQIFLAEHECCTNWRDCKSNKSNQIKSNQMLVFEERGKPEFPEKNLSEQSREPTNSGHI